MNDISFSGHGSEALEDIQRETSRRNLDILSGADDIVVPNPQDFRSRLRAQSQNLCIDSIGVSLLA